MRVKIFINLEIANTALARPNLKKAIKVIPDGCSVKKKFYRSKPNENDVKA